MKNLIYLAFFLLPALFLISNVGAAVAIPNFTASEVALHNTKQDCWMIFEGKVYNFSDEHLQNHLEKFMDITPWCGKDMTEAFTTKAGSGEDHKPFVYSDLENYYLGEFVEGERPDPATQTASTKVKSPYNYWLPVVLSLGAYMVYWGITKTPLESKFKLLDKRIFDLTFNSVLFLGLIPSFIFGIIMVFAYQSNFLRDINFNFLYWHVELSIAFGTLLCAHFFTRFRLYKAPLKILIRRKPQNVTPASNVVASPVSQAE